jgi:hypothetical protein
MSPSILKPHDNIHFCASDVNNASLTQVKSKIDVLKIFNCKIVALLNLDFSKIPNQTEVKFEDIAYNQLTYQQSPEVTPLNLVGYALVRDIDYENGTHLIPTSQTPVAVGSFNSIMVVNKSVFNFPTSYLLQPDV